MFILKSTHEKMVKLLELSASQHQALMFNQIEDLKYQIEDLKRLVFPTIQKADAPQILEADAVITGSDKPYQMSEEEFNKIFAASREADLLFSGNYDTDHDLQ